MKSYLEYTKLLEDTNVPILPAGDTPKDSPAEVYKDIINLDYKDFINVLSNDVKNPRIDHLLKAGLKDGKPDDEKMKFTKEIIKVSDLRPTQREIDLDKSLKVQLTAQYPDQIDMILDGKSVEVRGPIVTLNSKYIIDGHHRWSQIYAMNPQANMSCVNINFDISPIEALKTVQMAIAAEVGSVPVEHVEGKNMYDCRKYDIYKYVKKHICKLTYDKLVEFKKILPHEEHNMANQTAARYFWKNIHTMQKISQPAKGSPDRGLMPQTEYAPNWEKTLASGEINFKDPFNSVKESKIPKYSDFINLKR